MKNSTQSRGKWGDGGHFLLIWKQKDNRIRQWVALKDKERERQRETEKKDACVRERKEDPEALAEWLFVSHPLPLWHRTQSNSPHSWPRIRLASRDLVSLPQLNAHPHIINNCFVHRSIKGLFIKSPFASSKIPLLSSLLHLRRWQRLAEFPFRFHVCGFSFFFFFPLFFSWWKTEKGVKEGLKAHRLWGKLLKPREKTYGNLLVWM